MPRQRIAPILYSMDINQRALAIHESLLDFFGYPQRQSDLPPLDELILTILSQNTNDVNRDRAYRTLRERFPTWELVRDASEREIIEAIRQAGLANQKGPRIQEILRQIDMQRGKLDLEFLDKLSFEQAREWLLSFNGVGPKTAAIVLLFSLGKPAFPVDTHIYRVTGRLGVRPLKMNADQAHQHLARLFPPDAYYAVHINLIRLGREICQARYTNCPSCPLQGYCDYYATNYAVNVNKSS